MGCEVRWQHIYSSKHLGMKYFLNLLVATNRFRKYFRNVNFNIEIKLHYLFILS